MPRSATINFRGEDAEVDYCYEYDPSVGIDGVSEWWFTGDYPTDWQPTDEEYEEVANVLTFFARQDEMHSDDF